MTVSILSVFLTTFSFAKLIIYAAIFDPIVRFIDIIVYSFVYLPLKPFLYLLGIDIHNISELVPHVQFFVSTLYHFTSVAILFGATVGVFTGLVLGCISYLLTPSPRKPQNEGIDLGLLVQPFHQPASLTASSAGYLSNAPNKGQSVSFSNLKIDIKYDTPSPELIPKLDNKFPVDLIPSMKSGTSTSAVGILSEQSSLKNRFDSLNNNELFTIRSNDTDLTYPTNEIKNYERNDESK